jgi:CRP-like cAMP-binding protein
LFDELVASHPPFRQYVFGSFAERLTDPMELVEAVAFHKLDRRVAATLLGCAALPRGPERPRSRRPARSSVTFVTDARRRVAQHWS